MCRASKCGQISELINVKLKQSEWLKISEKMSCVYVKLKPIACERHDGEMVNNRS